MKTPLVLLTTVAITFAVVGWYLYKPIHLRTRLNRQVQREYNAATNGMSYSDLLARFGYPAIRTNEFFNLPQYKGYEDQFAKTNGISASQYRLWRNGINWYYSIGFDSNDKVVVKGQGGS